MGAPATCRFNSVFVPEAVVFGYSLRSTHVIMGVVANLFYLDLGYSKTEIASVSKVFGVLMTIVIARRKLFFMIL